MNIKSTILNHVINARGPRTPKYVVFESDDWGGERMPDRETYNNLESIGFNFSRAPYEKYDSIAREEDLTALFDVLSKYKDIKGHHPVFTALSVVANPDFEAIKQSGFEEYKFQTIDKTFSRYSAREGIMECWKQGISDRVFFPQFHGREHLNVCQWLRDLKTKDNDNRQAFEYGIPGFFERSNVDAVVPYARAYRCYCNADVDFMVNSVTEGLDIFERLFGYRSLSVMAPAYTWNGHIEKAYRDAGVKYIQSAFYQNLIQDDFTHKVVHHYLGQKNGIGQRYLLRNCSFEPAQNGYSKNVVDECLKEMEIAFAHHKPATISTHRLNYIGAIFEMNRKLSLTLLDELLGRMLKEWPNIQFVNSAELGKIIFG